MRWADAKHDTEIKARLADLVAAAKALRARIVELGAVPELSPDQIVRDLLEFAIEAALDKPWTNVGGVAVLRPRPKP